MTALVIVMLGAIAALNWMRFSTALYPATFHALVWMFVLLGYEAMRPEVLPLNPVILVVVLAGTLAFSTGALVTCPPSVRTHSRRLRAETLPSKSVCDALLVVVALGVVPFLLRARAIAAGGPSGNFLIDLRLAIDGNPTLGAAPASFGVFQYLVPLSVVTMGLTLLRDTVARARGRVALSIVLALTYAFVATGRTYLLFVVLVYSVIRVTTGRISLAKAGLGVGTAGLLLFVGIALALGKAGAGTAGDVAHELQVYAFAGIGALGQRVRSGMPLAWGTNTFRTVLAALAAAHVPVSVPNLVQPYEFIPLPTNVYTFYLPYFADFGYVGTSIAAFIVGALHGKSYEGASRGDARWVLAFALLSYPLFMQFFEDQYLTLLSSWVQMFAWSAIAFIDFRTLAREIRRAIVARSIPVAGTVSR